MNMKKQDILQNLINAYAEAYQNLGYSSLMGKIVSLLIATPEALSLDEISEQLQMSKGPVSQIARKLKEHQLIEKVWIPGERKDYYRAVPDIFGQAFANYASSMRRNKKLGENVLTLTEECPVQDDQLRHMAKRMREMIEFYDRMDALNKSFLEEWQENIRPEMLEDPEFSQSS
ncbi:MAG: hypothetical protein LAT67_10990 [Balneolales bacterium]|nr:hypothetical protein [Balneolales bacterium]